MMRKALAGEAEADHQEGVLVCLVFMFFAVAVKFGPF